MFERVFENQVHQHIIAGILTGMASYPYQNKCSNMLFYSDSNDLFKRDNLRTEYFSVYAICIFSRTFQQEIYAASVRFNCKVSITISLIMNEWMGDIN